MTKGTHVGLVLGLRVWVVGLSHVCLCYVGHVRLGLGLGFVVGALVVVLPGLRLVVRLAGGCVFIVVPGGIGECCTGDEGGRSQEGDDGGLEEHLELK